MQIDISEIVSCENREVTEKVHIEQDTFVSRLGEFPITESAPFDLRIANREGSELLLSGETDLTVSIPCSRCLTEVPTDIHIVIDKKLRMDGTEVVDDEMEETDYLIGLNLDIDKLIYGEILVNWPMKVLCREDCKGICKVCGMNLNKGNCDCQRTELESKLENDCSCISKMQQVWRADDASQSMQELWLLQQKRNHSAGLIPAVQKRSGFPGLFFV